jgi:hypothetical protein
MIPISILVHVASFQDAEGSQAMHCVSKEVAGITTGMVKMTPKQLYHFRFSQRLHNLRVELASLHQQVVSQKFLPPWKNGKHRKPRAANVDAIYANCIQIRRGGVMGIIARVEAGMDRVARRDGVERVAYSGAMAVMPVLSGEPEFTKEDIAIIRSYLCRLRDVAIHTFNQLIMMESGRGVYSAIVCILRQKIAWLDAHQQ